MAKSEWTTSHALRVEKWSAVLFKYSRYKNFFAKFMGPNVRAKGVDISTSPNALCQLKGDFKAGSGDKVHYGMVAPLRGVGRIEGQKLEDSEEAMSAYEWSLTLKETTHAVRGHGKLSDKRIVFDTKQQAKQQLKFWMANRVDTYSVAALSGVASDDGNVAANAPSSNRKWVGGQTTADVITKATSNLDANFGTNTNELFGPAVIEWVKRQAIVSEPLVAPIMLEGKEWYVIFIHPYQAKALKASTAWKSAHLYSDVRGYKNAFFTGSLGAWDNVVIHTYSKIETRYGEGGSTASEVFDTGDDVASGKYAARALFCGAQAVCQAYGELPHFVEDGFDYGREWGVSVQALVVAGKPEFNSEDHGVIVVDTQYQAD